MSAMAFNALDINHDGVITRAEFDQAYGQPMMQAAPVMYAAPATQTYAAPAVTYAAPQPVMQYAAPQPVMQYAAPQPVMQYAAPQPVMQYAAPPQPVMQAAPVMQYAAPVQAQAQVSNIRPHPTMGPVEVSSTAHPPQRLQHEEAQPISYVGHEGAEANLITNEANYQPTHQQPMTDFHQVNRFVPQSHLQAAGAEQVFAHGGAFGPRMAAGSAGVTYGAPPAPAPVMAPQMAFAAPQMTYAAPQMAVAAPQMTYAAPQTTYAAPQMTYGAPAMSGFDAMDRNHDGMITQAEFNAAMGGGSASMGQPMMMHAQ